MHKISTNQPSEKQIYFWNTLGGILNASFSVIIMVILTHIAGVYVAGIFSLGYSNAMMLQHIGSFDSRSYQCSIFDKTLDFSVFLVFRIFTSLIMLLATLILIRFFNYTGDKALATLILSLFCVAANISDIFQGNAQKSGRLDLAGKSLSFRIIFSVIIFYIVLSVSNDNLMLALSSITLFGFIWIIMFDIKKMVFEYPIVFSLNKTQFGKVFVNTFPLFLSLFSQMFIFNMPKYAIDNYMPVENQAIYGILFMPASIVSLLATFLYRPIMVQLSHEWENKQYNIIIKTCLSRIFFVIVAIIIIVVGGAFFGPQVLTILYGTDVNSYRKELIFLLIGGGFSGISVLLYYLMTIVKKQYYMVVAHFAILFFSWLVSYNLVNTYGLLGASLGYLFAIVALDILLLCMLIIIFYHTMKGDE